MTQVTDPTSTSTQPPSDTDLAAEVQRVLEGSSEPLTLSKIRSSLPARLTATKSSEFIGRIRKPAISSESFAGSERNPRASARGSTANSKSAPHSGTP